MDVTRDAMDSYWVAGSSGVLVVASSNGNPVSAATPVRAGQLVRLERSAATSIRPGKLIEVAVEYDVVVDKTLRTGLLVRPGQRLMFLGGEAA